MIVKAPQLERALAEAARTRLFLFYGPEESGSRALVAKVAAAMGEGAERVDLRAADLRDDPAGLADEAAAFSMFGGSRYIVVDRAGDEILTAVEGLLALEVAGNPVVLIAGDLKKGSKLVQLAAAHPAAVGHASYAVESRDAPKLVGELGRAHGLIVPSDLALRIAADCGGNRGVIDQELAKYALYAEASPEAPRTLDHAIVDAVGAGAEGDLSRLVDSVADGRAAALEEEITRLRAEGREGISLTRTVLRRLLLLVRLRAKVEEGSSVAAVMASSRIFWKEQGAVARQLGRWRSELLARAVSRLVEAERQVMAPGGPGPLAAEAELFAICRQAARLR